MKLPYPLELVKKTAVRWNDDGAPHLGAAIAFYSGLSLAPLVLVCIAAAGAVFDSSVVRTHIVGLIQSVGGEAGESAVNSMLASSAQERSGVLATIVGIVTLLAGASGVFGEIQFALNTIWKVKAEPSQVGFTHFLRQRFLSFGMVLVIAFLLLVSLILNAVLTAAATGVGASLPGGAVIWHVIDTVASLGVETLLFAMIFKVLPDVKLEWRDVWVGAAATAVLFSIGKILIGIYFGASGIATSYGGAASVVVLFVWIYYSAQIMLFGAEFTSVWAARHGSPASAEAGAVAAGDAVASDGTPPRESSISRAASASAKPAPRPPREAKHS